MTRVLMLPGFDGTGELFAPLIAALPDSYRAVVLRYEHERVFDDYVESAAAQLPERNGVLIAESFSGPVALSLMARYPERIRCTVLCATFVVSPFHTLTKLARFVPPALLGIRVGQRFALRTFCLDDPSDQTLENLAVSVLDSVPARTILDRIGVLSRLSVTGICPDIRHPILGLRATRDRLVGELRHRQLVEMLPTMRVVDIDGPHLLLQSRPHECANAIKNFVGELDS